MLAIDHYAKPADKQKKEYFLTAAKAAQSDFYGQNHQMFAKNAGRYDENRLYGINKPPIGKFKSLRGLDPKAATSELAVDWTFRGPGAKFVDLMVEKILAIQYTPVATPIDPTSRDEQNDYIKELRTKLLLQQSLQQAGVPEAAGMTQLQTAPTDPKDIEDLEMRLNIGEQFNRAVDMGLLIQLAFWENKVPTTLRPAWVRDMVTCGPAVYKDSLDANGDPKVEYVDPGMFGCSFCESEDFSDIVYAFRLLQVPVGELRRHFNDKEWDDIKTIPRREGYNQFKTAQVDSDSRYISPKPGHILVMELEFYTWDDYHWEMRTSKYGNPLVKEVGAERAANGAGRDKYKYTSKTTRRSMEVKWIVGTEYVYEYGPKEGQKRDTDLSGGELSFKPFAANVNKMICSSMVDKLKPHMDDYMANNISIQNMVNKMVPNGFSFDMDALENVNMTMGGRAMTPEDIVKLFYKTGQHMFRSSGLNGQNGNGKAIEPVQNEDFGSLVALINRQSVIVQSMRDDTGLNEITDGSTPAERTGVGVANLANSATNTALRPLIRCDDRMQTDLGYDSYLRTLQAIRRNPDYGGSIPGINKGTWQFVKADAKMTKRQYAIMLEMRATDEEKAVLIQDFKETFSAGLLDPTDLVTLLNTHSLGQAQMLWADKIARNQKRMAAEKQQNAMQTIEGQATSAERAEKAKQETVRLEGWLDYKRELLATRKAVIEANIKVTNAANTDILVQLEDEIAAVDQMLMPQEEEG